MKEFEFCIEPREIAETGVLTYLSNKGYYPATSAVGELDRLVYPEFKLTMTLALAQGSELFGEESLTIEDMIARLKSEKKYCAAPEWAVLALPQILADWTQEFWVRLLMQPRVTGFSPKIFAGEYGRSGKLVTFERAEGKWLSDRWWLVGMC